MLLDQGVGKRSKRSKRINITPLIDIVFILLLFFMLSSNFQHWRQIDLSSAEKTEENTEKKTVRLLRILDDQGVFTVDGKSIARGDQIAMQRLIHEEPEAVFAIEAAEGVQTQSVISLLDSLKQQGAKHVSLAGVLP